MATSKRKTRLIVFGATGDLMAIKLLPAISTLLMKQLLPKDLDVVGVGRRAMSDDEFRALMRQSVSTRLGGATERFLAHFSYAQADASKPEEMERFTKAWGDPSTNRLVFLAIPPDGVEAVVRQLSAARFMGETGGAWARLLIEKPIGTTLAEAENLNMLLGELFEERQVYRIEHYLAKHTVQNILAFRFSNNLFDPIWNNRGIDSIHIRLHETIGVEKRGAFYDAIGALRDVGQNHLLQLLALITMDAPASFEADDVRTRRAEILESLKTPTAKWITSNTIRAQYDGYQNIKGVSSGSMTETFFRINAELTHPEWQGVRIVMESGKRLPEVKKEVEVIFQTAKHVLCPNCTAGAHPQNRLMFELQPEELIRLELWNKVAGHGFDVEPRNLELKLREPGSAGQYVEEYATVIHNAMIGDARWFVTTRELKAMWTFIDPIVKAWEQGKVEFERYRPGHLPAVD